jgi:hypothetical protein
MFCSPSSQRRPDLVWLTHLPGQDYPRPDSATRLLRPTVPEADCPIPRSPDFSWSMVAGAQSEQQAPFSLSGDADFFFE